MKKFGFDLVQNKCGDGKDFLIHRARGNDYKVETNNIPLDTQNGILMMNTCKVEFTKQQHLEVKKHIQGDTGAKGRKPIFYFEITKSRKMEVCPLLMLNEGTC